MLACLPLTDLLEFMRITSMFSCIHPKYLETEPESGAVPIGLSWRVVREWRSSPKGGARRCFFCAIVRPAEARKKYPRKFKTPIDPAIVWPLLWNTSLSYWLLVWYTCMYCCGWYSSSKSSVVLLLHVYTWVNTTVDRSLEPTSVA